jgi:D-glycero-D-manno-heptose 1,7-bisphosphate phosphatase
MKRALFLDRDGVINEDHDYVYRSSSFRFIRGIFHLCRVAQRLKFSIVVVTNQAGIGRGLYTEQDFQELTAWMLKEFSKRSISVARVYHCPYHPQHGKGHYRRDSPMRKPRPGMILKARRDLELDLQASVLVGDKSTDIAAGKAANVGSNILLSRDAVERRKGGADWNASSLADVAKWLERAGSRGCKR